MNYVLIVDDDALFRTNFAALVDWEKHNLSILQADNGEKALHILEEKREQILCIFTDIDMPVIDGIELVRYVTENQLNTKIIVLSAYDNFHYVKTSLLSGASDYILKHTLDSDLIEELLEKHLAVLPSVQSDRLKQDIRSQFLGDMLEGHYRDHQNLDKHFELLGLPTIKEYFSIAIIVPALSGDAWPLMNANSTKMLLDMLNSIINRIGIGIAFQNPNDQNLYALISSDEFKDTAYATSCLNSCAKRFEDVSLRYFNIRVKVAYSAVCRGINDVEFAYHQLQSALGIGGDGADRPAVTPEKLISSRFAEELETHVRFDSGEEINECISALFYQARQYMFTAKQCRGLAVALTDLHNNIVSNLQGEGILLPIKPADQSALLAMKDGIDYRDYCQHLFCSLSEQLWQYRTEKYRPLICRTLRIIFQQYGNPALSLNYIADALNTNPAYLSRMFKQDLDWNISTYITMHRLTRAKVLLYDGTRKIKDIATICGFDSPNYFFTIFKKYLGVTPKEYADSLQLSLNYQSMQSATT